MNAAALALLLFAGASAARAADALIRSDQDFVILDARTFVRKVSPWQSCEPVREDSS